MKLYVGNLSYHTTSQDLADLFGRVGQVLSAEVITERDSGRSKGFGFVEMSHDEEAQKAIDQFNGSSLGDRTIVVNRARERREHTSGGGNRSQRGEWRSISGEREGYRDRRD